MPNNASEIVEGVDGVSQERAGNCETSGSTNVTAKRVRKSAERLVLLSDFASSVSQNPVRNNI